MTLSVCLSESTSNLSIPVSRRQRVTMIMLTVLWFDNFVTLLTTIPGKWWKHKQNLWKGWKKCLSEPLFLSKLLFVYSPSKEFPWKCLQADPETQPCGLWGLVRTDWKKQSSSERELNPIRLLFCAHCTSLVDRLTIISCSCSVRKYETNQCQVYAETLMMVYILYMGKNSVSNGRVCTTFSSM